MAKGDGRGGARAGAGRRKSKVDEKTLESPGFATTVLGRIGEGPPAKITCAEDYALDLLFQADMQTRSVNFNRLIDRKFGKAAQGSFQGDTRESGKALERGNLPTHFQESKNSTRSNLPN